MTEETDKHETLREKLQDGSKVLRPDGMPLVSFGRRTICGVEAAIADYVDHWVGKLNELGRTVDGLIGQCARENQAVVKRIEALGARPDAHDENVNCRTVPPLPAPSKCAPHCHTTARITCTWCHGKGCDKCYGNGWFDMIDERSANRERDALRAEIERLKDYNTYWLDTSDKTEYVLKRRDKNGDWKAWVKWPVYV